MNLELVKFMLILKKIEVSQRYESFFADFRQRVIFTELGNLQKRMGKNLTKKYSKVTNLFFLKNYKFIYSVLCLQF